MSGHRTLAAAAALVLGLAACDNLPVDAPADDQLEALFAQGGGTPEPRAATGGSGGSVLDVLNSRIEGFAGIFRSTQCSVVLLLTSAADAESAVRITAAVINPLVARTCPRGITVTPQRATYSYNELLRFHSLLRPLAGAEGVFQVALNLPGNVIQVVVADSATARRVVGFLQVVGVPQDAVSVRIRGTSSGR